VHILIFGGNISGTVWLGDLDVHRGGTQAGMGCQGVLGVESVRITEMGCCDEAVS